MCACVCLQNRDWPVFVLFVRALMFWSVRKDLTAKRRGEEEAVCGILTIGWRINQHLRERRAASAHYCTSPILIRCLDRRSVRCLYKHGERCILRPPSPSLPLFFCCCPLDSSTWLSNWMSWSDTYSPSQCVYYSVRYISAVWERDGAVPPSAIRERFEMIGARWFIAGVCQFPVEKNRTILPLPFPLLMTALCTVLTLHNTTQISLYSLETGKMEGKERRGLSSCFLHTRCTTTIHRTLPFRPNDAGAAAFFGSSSSWALSSTAVKMRFVSMQRRVFIPCLLNREKAKLRWRWIYWSLGRIPVVRHTAVTKAGRFPCDYSQFSAIFFFNGVVGFGLTENYPWEFHFLRSSYSFL